MRKNKVLEINFCVYKATLSRHKRGCKAQVKCKQNTHR